MMGPVESLAESIRADRKPVAPDNPLLALEGLASSWISTWWEGFRQVRNAATEATFLGVYGSPLLQAMVGLGTVHAPTERRIARDLMREVDEASMRADLEGRFEVGGIRQAAVRGALYVGLPERSVDERAFAMLQAIRATLPANERVTMAEFKVILKEQYLLLRLDEERAVRAIPRLLPDDADARRAGLDALRRMVTSRGALSEEGASRLKQVERLFGAPAGTRPLKVVNA
jgi:hypothetical protein